MNIALLIHRSAERYPDRTALKCEQRAVSYAELDRLIRQYQGHLEALPPAASRPVAVVAYKSIDAVAFTQAALRCGLAYTIVDPRYPIERIALILRDSKPAAIFSDLEPSRLQLATAGLPPFALVLHGPHTDVPDAVSADEIGRRAPTNSGVAVCEPQQIAYVLYTSGSTGVPKGVKLSHGNARFSIDWAQDAFKFDCSDVFLNQAHFGFDFCVIDHYNAWNVGASVILVPEYDSVFPAHVVELIKTEGITNLWLVPSNIVSLITRGGLLTADSSRIRRFLYGGEPFPMPYLRQVHQWMAGRNVFNLYGPTETNLITAHRIDAADLTGDEVPLGRVLPGITIRLATDDDRLVARGKGEILASGPSVTEGYTNRPDLNASRFVTRQGRIWYRTGDLAYVDDYDLLWYRGRVDNMVKVRGYRVELQEIETAMVSMPGVREAVVVVGKGDDGDRSIHAFCVGEPSIDERALGAYLATRLPTFMVPRRFHLIDRIPYNDRGKADRQALRQGLET